MQFSTNIFININCVNVFFSLKKITNKILLLGHIFEIMSRIFIYFIQFKVQPLREHYFC